MIRIIQIIVMFVALLGLSSCHETIHIHPWEEPECNEKILLTLEVDNDAPLLGAVVDYTIDPPMILYSDNLPENILAHAHGQHQNTAGTQDKVLRAHALADAFNQIAPYDLDGSKWELHIKYEVYPGDIDRVIAGLLTPIYADDVVFRADTSHPAHEVQLEMAPGNITVVAVAHIVPAGTDGDWFFDTSTLYRLYCNMDKRQGEHDNVYRDCFVAGQQFQIRSTGIDGNVQHFKATLTRPQGRYMTLADDYETYLQFIAADLDNVSSHIHYPSYINVAYSPLTNMPMASSYDFGYDNTPSLLYVDHAPYVRLGNDWSFVNGNRSNFNVNITVRDKDNNRVINHNSDILVPVFPGRVTIVLGHWLTEINDSSGGGGVLVDPEFTDEIVIHF